MAYHFSAKVIGMGDGGSAVHRAAYQARCQLESERLGLSTKDYAYKGDLQWEGIFAGKGAGDWTRDRQQLWNRAEAAERQANGQPARDFEMSIPNILTRKQQIQIVTDFAREQFARKGLVGDAKLHSDYDEHGQMRPGADPDEPRNDHVHLMATTRPLEGDGFARTKTDLRHMNSKEQLVDWREAWAKGCAKALRRAGHEQEADRWGAGHLTLPAQREAALARGDVAWAEQLDREPDIKMGGAAWHMEARGEQSDRGDERREAQARNAERRDLKGEAQIIDLALARQERQPSEARQQADRQAQWQNAQRVTRERDRFTGWANARRAEAQSARLDAETSQGRDHQRDKLALDNRHKADQPRRDRQQAALDAIARAQQRKGLGGFLYRATGRAGKDEAAATAIKATLRDQSHRQAEERQALNVRHEAERKELAQHHGQRDSQLEQRIERTRERREREGWQDRAAEAQISPVEAGKELGDDHGPEAAEATHGANLPKGDDPASWTKEERATKVAEQVAQIEAEQAAKALDPGRDRGRGMRR